MHMCYSVKEPAFVFQCLRVCRHDIFHSGERHVRCNRLFNMFNILHVIRMYCRLNIYRFLVVFCFENNTKSRISRECNVDRSNSTASTSKYALPCRCQPSLRLLTRTTLSITITDATRQVEQLSEVRNSQSDKYAYSEFLGATQKKTLAISCHQKSVSVTSS